MFTIHVKPVMTQNEWVSQYPTRPDWLKYVWRNSFDWQPSQNQGTLKSTQIDTTALHKYIVSLWLDSLATEPVAEPGIQWSGIDWQQNVLSVLR